MNPTKTEVIKTFLTAMTHPDLAALYNYSMEVQVNVLKANGTPVKMVGVDFKGKEYNAYTDGTLTWKPIRIPYKAKSEPEYTDGVMTWPIENYAEGIGMTGWDWKQRRSLWVAFDFDAIVGHSDRHGKKLDDTQLLEIQSIVRDIPFVTLRQSTSGKGLHLYVFLEPVPTANHTEHAALARSILAMLSGLTGHDLTGKVDICGGNMWVWHRKMTPENGGLKLIKQGEKLKTVPANWKDHLKVTTRRTQQALPSFGEYDHAFAELTGERTKVQLDNGHRALVEWLSSNGCVWWWDQDANMLVTHSFHLKEAHTALKMCGDFDTVAQGSERGADHNCFLFPLRNSGWVVRRFSPGTKEHDSWEQDGSGWTRCFLNRPADFVTLARLNGGVKDEKGAYHFRHADRVQKTLQQLRLTIDLPSFVLARKAVIKPIKEGEILVAIDAEDSDDGSKLMQWRHDKKQWKRVFNFKLPTNTDTERHSNYDDLIRHVTTADSDAGWYLKRDGGWVEEPLTHIKAAVCTMGEDAKDINQVIGSSVIRAWTLVNKPFQPEYPGNREWNRGAAQFAISPTLELEHLKYPHWTLILNHLGTNLTQGVLKDKWCQEVGIVTGAEYLTIWLASLFRKPEQPSAYLAFFGLQDCGKSIFHEAIDQILLTNGVVRADNALQNASNFNGELLNAILAVVEETDLAQDKRAYNRIKDWVTSPKIMIRPLYMQGFMVPNMLHFIHCQNEMPTFVFDGDSRITMIRVPPLTTIIPKLELMSRLKKEAPDFLAAVLALELPITNSRLAVPAVETEEKKRAMEKNRTLLEQFISEMVYEIPGHMISAEDFHNQFQLWLDERDRAAWTRNKVGRELPERFPRGRVDTMNQKVHYGNMTFDKDAPPKARLYTYNLYLKEEKQSA
jgi:hypothetical protein